MRGRQRTPPPHGGCHVFQPRPRRTASRVLGASAERWLLFTPCSHVPG